MFRSPGSWSVLMLLLGLAGTSRGQDTLRIDTRDLPSDIVYQLITPDDSLVVTPVDGHIDVPMADSTTGTYRLSATSTDNDVTIQFTHDAEGIQNVTVITDDSQTPLDSAMFGVEGDHTLVLHDGPVSTPAPSLPPYRILLKDGMLMTPDGDGDHDQFRVEMNTSLSSYALTITNKRGQQVFHSTDPAEGWNGRTDNTGDLLPTGVYLYALVINGVSDNGKFILER